MPAEWEPHEGTWLAWPHEKSDWPGKFAPIPWVYCEIIRHLARVERVHILVDSRDSAELAKKHLRRYPIDLAAVDFFGCPTDRSWTRDFCPTFVRGQQRQVTVLNWQFNGWAKYDNWKRDDAVALRIAKRLKLPAVTPEYQGKRVVLEGGSIDVNGAGTMLTTEECLLSPIQARNPQLSREDIEAIFGEFLGIRETIWLKNGIAGDDTHGHIDDLARFVREETIVIAVENEKGDANFEPTQENLRLLRKRRDVRVVPLPMPEPVYFGGQRLPASYANFYIANGLVLVPVFNDPKDRVALNTLAKLFPDRQVVGIACSDLVLGLGTLHCMTQQQIA